MKKKTTLLLFILIAAAILSTLFIFRKNDKIHFTRLRFIPPGGKPVENGPRPRPGFLRYSYSEGDTLHIEPGIKGETGMMLSLSGTGDGVEKNRISLRIKRKKKVIYSKSRTFKKRQYNLQVSERFDFHGSEIVEISFSGSGKVLVRDPLFYKIIDQGKREYVFVIALDNLRYDRLGRTVNGVLLTPNLNRFKTDSVSFKNGYSQSSWTLPAFTSLFTGLYEFNHGMTRDGVLAAEIPMLSESFAPGFITVSINGGAWLGPGITDQRGFDLFSLGSRTKDVDAAERFFDNSIRFLEKNEFPRLFMFMHTFSIHAPYFPPERFLYEIDKEPEYKFLKAFTHDKQFLKGVPDKERQARELLYDADVKAFDFYFGTFIDHLKKTGIYDRSLIVFLSDHGEEFYEHGGWFHGHSHYDEIIRIPIFIKFPGNIHAGSEVSDLAGIIDVLPTLGDYLGLEMPVRIDGISLMPMVDGRCFKERSLISSTTKCQIGDRSPKTVAIIRNGYKFLYNMDNVNRKGEKFVWQAILDRGENELYDLNTDPAELINLSSHRPDLIRSFKKELIDILIKVNKNIRTNTSKKTAFDETEKERLKTLGYL